MSVSVLICRNDSLLAHWFPFWHFSTLGLELFPEHPGQFSLLWGDNLVQMVGTFTKCVAVATQ